MSSSSELPFLPALTLAEMVRRGSLTAAELTDVVVERIERLDGRLGAFVTVDRDGARRAAEAADGDPPFGGVPIAVKDLARTAGLRTTYSSRAYAGYVPDVDDRVVADVREAGFVVVGKTNTPEFGLLPVTESELNGRTVNPWSPEHTCGGSSGGAAVAVAAGLVPVAHGSDGAGSIRIPASCCGVLGVKPAACPARYRVRPGPGGDPVDGVLSRTVSDARAYLRAVSGIGGERPVPGRVRVAVTVRPPTGGPVDPECRRAVESAADALAASGADVTWEDPRWDGAGVVDDLMLLRSSTPIAFGDPPASELDASTRDAFALAARSSAADLHRAVVRVRAYAERAARILGRYDALLCPTLATPPVRTEHLAPGPAPDELFHRFAAFSPFAAVANLCSLPSASVPVHWTGPGLPVGVLVTGGPGGIDVVLALCEVLEERLPWAHRRPPVR